MRRRPNSYSRSPANGDSFTYRNSFANGDSYPYKYAFTHQYPQTNGYPDPTDGNSFANGDSYPYACPGFGYYY